MKRSWKLSAASIAAASALFGAVTIPAIADADDAAGAPVVVASKLNNPRQLSLTNDGVLLAAEAGKGGTQCQGEGEEQQCVGATGAVSAFFQPGTSVNASPVRVVTGLASGAGPGGAFAVGSDGASARQFIGGKIYTQITFAPPESGELADAQSGKLLVARPGEAAMTVADISAFETENDPDGFGVESNPYAVLDLGDHQLVADAAGNSILKVASDGSVTLFRAFANVTTPECTTAGEGAEAWPGYDPTPEFPGCHFVPTSLALGPDSDIYVGGLVSEQLGQGQVVRLDHATGEIKRTYSGFTGVTGVALDNAGSLYVSSLFAPQANPIDPQVAGVVSQIRQDGTRTDKDVPFPAGIAVDQNRNVYVAAFSVFPETGAPDSPAGVDTSGQIWKLKW